MSGLKTLVDEFELQLSRNPYDSSTYDRILGKLATLNGGAETVNYVYLNKTKHFRLTQSELNHWLSQLRSIEDANQRLVLEYEFYNNVADDYMTVLIMQNYLKLADQLLSVGAISDTDFRGLLSKALSVCSYDFQQGNLVWKIVLAYFEQVFAKTKDENDLETLVKLHRKRLSFPHAELQKSFQELSSLISTHMHERYEEQMGIASSIFNATQSKLNYYQKYENQIRDDPTEVSTWISYMKDVFKYSGLKPAWAIFERSIQSDVARIGKWQKVWLSFIDIVHAAKDENVLQLILSKFVREFPYSCQAFAANIRNCTLYSQEGQKELEQLQKRIHLSDLMNSSDYNEWRLIANALLHLKYQSLLNSTAFVEVHDFMTEMATFFEFALKHQDRFHSVEKFVIAICIKLGKTEKAMEFLERFYQKFGKETEVWLYAVEKSADLGLEMEHIRSLFILAFANELDSSERLKEEWLLFEEVNGDVSSYQDALSHCMDVMEKEQIANANANVNVNVNVKVKEQEKEKGKEQEHDPTKKRTRDSALELNRSREEFTVEVRNLPADATDVDVRKFFENCGEIRDSKVVEAAGGKIAIVEFTSELDVFSALTRSHKSIGLNEVTVSQAQKSVLFVNNYPSTSSQSEITEHFARVGPLVSCRFPSQVKNKIRRFCYVQYVYAADAQKAVVMYNGQSYWDDNLKRELKWEVKFSKPQEKKERTSPISDRKIRVANIPFKVTKQEVEQLFAEAGDIESIVLPRAVFDTKNKRMKQNGGIAIIAYKEVRGAEAALRKDGMVLKGRALSVNRQQANSSRSVEGFDHLRTVGLIDLDPSLNAFQIKSFFERSFGQISNIMVMPEVKAGLIEFASIRDSGNVALISSPLELDTYKVRVSTRDEVLELLKESKDAGMADSTSDAAERKTTLVPTSIKRRRV
ncbi:uncharacterized protein LODBEIA_P08820 [Lodderomyces beijingensis]|uniref:RRM domain-containing protein n=1 Tax=Lodderomyces beijingensis TaxID=1775926 RepID=A0ABP0ZES5_9ASCO